MPTKQVLQEQLEHYVALSDEFSTLLHEARAKARQERDDFYETLNDISRQMRFSTLTGGSEDEVTLLDRYVDSERRLAGALAVVNYALRRLGPRPGAMSTTDMRFTGGEFANANYVEVGERSE